MIQNTNQLYAGLIATLLGISLLALGISGVSAQEKTVEQDISVDNATESLRVTAENPDLDITVYGVDDEGVLTEVESGNLSETGVATWEYDLVDRQYDKYRVEAAGQADTVEIVALEVREPGGGWIAQTGESDTMLIGAGVTALLLLALLWRKI